MLIKRFNTNYLLTPIIWSLLLTTMQQISAAETAAEPFLLKDIMPGKEGSNPQYFTELNGKVFFEAYDEVNGSELWVTDGTPAGTKLFMDIYPGTNSSYPDPGVFSADHFAVFGNKMYFEANSNPWVTDGTPEGTKVMANYISSPEGFTEFNGRVYFQGCFYSFPRLGCELISADSNSLNINIRDINSGTGGSYPSEFTELNGKLYFTANEGKHGYELWVTTDGTSATTKLVKDIRPGSEGSYPSELIEFKGKIYFFADNGTHGKKLWMTNGTEAGTTLVKNVNSSIYDALSSSLLTIFNDKLYFKADDTNYGLELWVSDGTSNGTRLFKDINNNSKSGNPQSLAVAGNKMYFSATDGENGYELWVTDGSSAGTKMLKDINTDTVYNPGALGYGSFPTDFSPVGDKVYFLADDGTHGYELWVTDGTEAGTKLVKDIYPGSARSIWKIAALGNKLFFAANDRVHGEEPWVINAGADQSSAVLTIIMKLLLDDENQ